MGFSSSFGVLFRVFFGVFFGVSVRFPPDGLLVSPQLRDQGKEVLGESAPPAVNVPVLGLYQTRARGPGGGRIVVYGDSNCIDGAHLSKPCYWLLDALREYTSAGHLPQVGTSRVRTHQ